MRFYEPRGFGQRNKNDFGVEPHLSLSLSHYNSINRDKDLTLNPKGLFAGSRNQFQLEYNGNHFFACWRVIQLWHNAAFFFSSSSLSLHQHHTRLSKLNFTTLFNPERELRGQRTKAPATLSLPELSIHSTLERGGRLHVLASSPGL